MLVKLIDQMFDNEEQQKRTYLGASVVGHECPRKVQFEWLNILGRVEKPKIQPRIKRIFNRGYVYEEVMKKWMRQVGFVFETDEEKLQFKDGDLAGHVDGVITIDGKTMLWENKCLGNKGETNLHSVGLRIAYPYYYVQIQLYLHFLKLTECLFTAINADTMSIYEEMITIDFETISDTLEKIKRIFSKTAENKFVEKTTNKYHCTYCDFKLICK